MTNVKKIVTPVLAVLLVSTTLAGAQTRTAPQTKTQPTTQTRMQTQQTQTQQRLARAPLTVKFYAGNPLQGGRLLSSTTVTPQERGSTATAPTNPFTGAPAGTTYVTISHGAEVQIMTLKDAQANPFPGGRGGHGRDGRDGRGGQDDRGGRAAQQGQQGQQGQPQQQGQSRGAPTGQGARGDHGGDIVPGLRLRGLPGASSVTFYSGDPLAGGKAQTTIKLGGNLTAQQQQALTVAAAKAKFAVIERPGGATVIDLSARSGMNR